MNKIAEKGMWRRTISLYKEFRVPWLLYLMQVVIGIINTKVMLLYIPYQIKLEMGQIDNMSTLWGYVGFMILASVVGAVQQVVIFYAYSILDRNLKDRLIEHSIRLPLRDYEKNSSQIISWIQSDSSADGLITSVIGFLTGVASVYMSVTTMAAIDTTMLYLVFVVLIYVVFSTWLSGRLLFLRERRHKLAHSELTAYMAEHLSFATQLKQMHTQKEEVSRGKKAVNQYYNAEVYQAVLTLIGSLVNGSLQRGMTILVFVLGIPMVRSGEMELAGLMNFREYILMAYGALSSLPALYTSFMLANGQLFYVSGLMAKKEETYDRERTMDIEDEDIIFDNVSFGYGEDAAVRNAALTIPKGKVTALVGPNGSGKSTLFKLIERFYDPDEGRVFFGPYDVEKLHLHEWRQSIAYVLQEPQLFNGTIRDNINYGMSREPSEEETVNAAKLACADEFIRELPGGYDFEIGENGCRLSAGQRQRIAIARAVMLNPAYLLLDEVTCNMDVYSEQAVTKALLRLMEGRTTVMITHDMKMLEHADHVIVLNHGRVEAEGSTDEVRRSSETLQRLAAANM